MHAGPDRTDVRPSPTGEDAQAGRRRVYTLVVLTAATFFYQLDRNVVYIVQELIKIEFRLSDTQLGLVTGLAYGLANGLAGLVVGWLIDRTNRAKVIATCVSVWSAMTAICGLATSFPFLLAARVGVGLAESGGTPTSLSIVSDLYPPERRASKIGIISAGYSLGTIVSALAGGYVAASYGWRAAFLLYGAPGLVLGLLMFTTLRDPPRARSAGEAPIPFAEVLRSAGWLVRRPGLRMIYLATAMTSMVSTGVYSWWSSFMMRVHHLDLPTVGVINTVGPGVCGVLGMILAGVAADWARRRAAGGPLMVVAATSAITFVSAAIALWTPSTAVMVAALLAAGGTMGAYIGPGNAVVSELTPPHLKGLAFAIPVVITNLVGAALGPLVVGVLSDAAQGALPQIQPLRAAMSAVLLLQVPVTVIYFLAGSARTRQVRASA
jgi:predicted MFS family arabinose efflux permease